MLEKVFSLLVQEKLVIPVIDGNSYFGPGLLNCAEIGPLGLWGLQGPTQGSDVAIASRERAK